MPETALATTGAPAAIASTSTFGIPSRSLGSSRHGMHSAPARRYSSSSSAGPIGPGQLDRPRALARRSARGRVAVLVVLADDRGLERHARLPQDAQASTSMSKPFLATSRPTPSTRRRAVALRRRRAVGEQAREVGGQAVVDEVDSRRGRDRAAGGATLASVQVTAKRAASSLRRSQPFGLSSRVDVARVAGERERQAGDARGEPGDRGRPVREVRVQVADVGRVEQPVGERDRLQQLLDVDLARAGERVRRSRTPGANAVPAARATPRGRRRATRRIAGRNARGRARRQRCSGLVSAAVSGRYSGAPGSRRAPGGVARARAPRPA